MTATVASVGTAAAGIAGTAASNVPPELQTNPFFIGIASILAFVIIALAIAKPIINTFKDYKNIGTVNERATAEVDLFSQMRIQLSTNTDAIKLLENEKNTWLQKSLELDGEVKRLHVFEDMVMELRTALARKDELLASKDAELQRFMNIILDMKDKLHAFEMRLIQSESAICTKVACPNRETNR